MTTTLAFFNLTGGVGRTTLVYHVAHMLVRMNRRVLLVDLDPQANLSEMCLPPERLDELWSEDHGHPDTVLGAVEPAVDGYGDVLPPYVEPMGDALGLLVGDPGLHEVEGALSDAWAGVWRKAKHDHAVLGAFHRVIQQAARDQQAELVLVDLGPNLGAINQAALLAMDHVATLVSPTPFVRGLSVLGSALARWRERWQVILGRDPSLDDLPPGRMDQLGYVVMHTRLVRSNSTRDWLRRLPLAYHRDVLRDDIAPPSLEDDASFLGSLRYMHGLIHLALDAHKPMFALKPADGAIGAFAKAVRQCEAEYRWLATNILDRLPATREE